MTLIEEMAQEVGVEVMIQICQIWGGQTLYIPDNPDEQHPIAQDIGYENLLRLVAVYGSQTIHPPSIERPHLAQRAKARFLIQQGLSERRIAWVLGVSVQRITHMLNGCKANAQWYERQEMEQELGAATR
ncbi:hypothetical protein ABIE59_003452 [Marinobacter sp. MBR-99]|uniref:hypothetical protein n=1 Tax=Marinobacter sp. MBR-99 TaxID=3156461 RepID=UPI0033968AF8